MNTKHTDKKHYVVKSMYLCRYLQQKGFELQKTRINKFNPILNVYLFDDTTELHDAIKEQTKARQTQCKQQEGNYGR